MIDKKTIHTKLEMIKDFTEIESVKQLADIVGDLVDEQGQTEIGFKQLEQKVDKKDKS